MSDIRAERDSPPAQVAASFNEWAYARQGFVLRKPMKRLVLLSILGISLVSACAKVGSKGIAQAEKAFLASETGVSKSVARPRVVLTNADDGAARGGASVASRPGTAAKRWAERIERYYDIDDRADMAYQIFCEILQAPDAGPLGYFPRPLEEVRPISQQPIVIDPVSGGFALPNNFGGFIFYTPQGMPLAFCAKHTVTGEMHYFSATGARIG